jgi:outer membrane murein-binding lipoprotein Lpp
MKIRRSMNRTSLSLLIASVGLGLTLNGCTTAQASESLNTDVEQLQQKVQLLETEVESLHERTVSQDEFKLAMEEMKTQTRSLKKSNDRLEEENLKLKRDAGREKAAQEKAAQERAQNPDKYALAAAFTDIEGCYGHDEIEMMAALGIFDSTEGEFAPTGSVTRAEFTRWLVKTNNRYAALDLGSRKLIRLSEHQESTFTDVSPDHPDFRYIQGMVDAGFVIGYDESTFAPDRPLSREELVAIKSAVDYNGNQQAERLQSFQERWSDSNKISKKYYGAFYWDRYTSSPNIERTFGSFKAFRPQKPASRAEVAICLTAITNHDNTIHGPKAAYASEALKKLKK